MFAWILLLNCWIVLTSIFAFREACPPPYFNRTTMTISPNSSFYSPGDLITYQCLRCFEPDSGNFTGQCEGDGTWADAPPLCKERNFEYNDTYPSVARYYKSVTKTGTMHGEAALAVDDSLVTYTTVAKDPATNTSIWKLELCVPMPIQGIKICNPNNTDENDDSRWCNIKIEAGVGQCEGITHDGCINPGECFSSFCFEGNPYDTKPFVTIGDNDGHIFNLAEVKVYPDIPDDPDEFDQSL